MIKWTDNLSKGSAAVHWWYGGPRTVTAARTSGTRASSRCPEGDGECGAAACWRMWAAGTS